MKKKFRLRNGMIENSDGVIIATVVNDAPDEDINVLVKSRELANAAERFVERVENGTLQPKKAYNEIKSALED